MARSITRGDFIDLFYKVQYRGLYYALKKLRLRSKNRITSTWEDIQECSANWWLVPRVRQRWNELITGNPETEYADYIMQKYFAGRDNLHAISVACGTGSHEVKFAIHPGFKMIKAFDISLNAIKEAMGKQDKSGLTNLSYFVADAYTFDMGTEKYDMVLFHSSLHHFSDPEELLLRVKKALKPEGILVINEYTGPNRFNLKEHQVFAINKALKDIPVAYREKFRSHSIKNRYYPPGKWRMFISDPSEAVASESIMPALRKHFVPLEEKKLGGNILHFLLKDIAHHFLNNHEGTNAILNSLFETEDHFLSENPSDFMFGVYMK